MGNTSTCTNETCTRETDGLTYLCGDCTAHLRTDLESIPDTVIPGPTEKRTRTVKDDAGNKTLEAYDQQVGPDRVIPGLAQDLTVAITKQSRFTQMPGSGRPTKRATDEHRTVLAEQPLAFGYAASEARTVLASTLAYWTAAIAEQRGLSHPAYTLTDMATFLATQVQWIRNQPAGNEAHDELTTAIRNARRAVDRPQDRVYAGPCSPEDGIELTGQERLLIAIAGTGLPTRCDGHLYAREGSTIATCDTCARDMPLNDARDPLLARIDNMHLTATEIVTALGGLGQKINANTLRVWVHRRLLTNHAPTGERPRYRVADVRSLATPTREAVPA